ncbi:hypothetical protein [Undibacterium sp. TC9W]|uniref:hypothetical protein n=1 Tax=Undibacterium sp. TC9W TaxID=3413053 RepID=UPI003BF21F3C
MKDLMNTPQDASNANAVLDQQFSLLHKDLQGLNTPTAIEQTLLQAFAKQQAKDKKKARSRRLRPWLAGLLTLCGSLGLLMMTVIFPASQHSLTPDSVAMAGTELPPFVALVPLERLNNETPSMLEAEVPAAWLSSLGVQVSPEIAGDLVQAQILVAADGEPLAMRLLK